MKVAESTEQYILRAIPNRHSSKSPCTVPAATPRFLSFTPMLRHYSRLVNANFYLSVDLAVVAILAEGRGSKSIDTSLLSPQTSVIALNSSFHRGPRGPRIRVARETLEGRINGGGGGGCGRHHGVADCVATGSGGREGAPNTRYASQSTFFCLPCLTFSIALSYAFPPPFLE